MVFPPKVSVRGFNPERHHRRTIRLQRYDIRNEGALQGIRQYILDTPLQWEDPSRESLRCPVTGALLSKDPLKEP